MVKQMLQIELDFDRIEEDDYSGEEFVQSLDNLFLKRHFVRDESVFPKLLYYGNNPERDNSYMALMYLILKRNVQLLTYSKSWLWLDKYEGEEELRYEDLLLHLTGKKSVC